MTYSVIGSLRSPTQNQHRAFLFRAGNLFYFRLCFQMVRADFEPNPLNTHNPLAGGSNPSNSPEMSSQFSQFQSSIPLSQISRQES